MIEAIMAACNNYFEAGTIAGEIEINSGAINVSLQAGQYFLIKGSIFNDGVHKYPDADLQDEVFNGAVYPLAVPKAFLDLVDQIETWQDKHPAGVMESETFGGQSYSYKIAVNGNGSLQTWEDAFAKQLRRWRKI